MIDDKYMLVGAHVDEATYNKIIEGKYVDFGKLIPHDRIAVEEDQRLEMIIKGGKTYWVPATETTSISNVIKWEQAFRVYSNIYTKQFPLCASKLIKYNQVIHSISSVYTWVYSYDKDFHIHMGKNPNRNWSIILQHSWSLRLRDKISQQDNSSSFNHNNNHKSGGGKSSDPCRHYIKENAILVLLVDTTINALIALNLGIPFSIAGNCKLIMNVELSVSSSNKQTTGKSHREPHHLELNLHLNL